VRSLVDRTLPGKSLDAQFDTMWARFQQLPHTIDTLNRWPTRLRRWLTPVNISFIVPIEDEAVCGYLSSAQEVLKPLMAYAPQPTDKLHITLYLVGYLRTWRLALPGTWPRAALDRIIKLAQENLAFLEPFEVEIGPINAFPNVAIAEVHDKGQLRMVRAAVAQATPRLARPLRTYPLVPHVTLGYFGQKPIIPILNVLRPMRSWPPVKYHIDRVDMTMYYRKRGPHKPTDALPHSEEEVIATLRIGEAGTQ